MAEVASLTVHEIPTEHATRGKETVRKRMHGGSGLRTWGVQRVGSGPGTIYAVLRKGVSLIYQTTAFSIKVSE